ncbi:ankyrin-2-like [Cloeon dipterum]|uniref:ankyrin-2-like n=1 Tax=Cloeon dipterum TaxID=197152 RepID=UPI00321F8985
MSFQETKRFLVKTTTGLTPLMLVAKESDLKHCLELVEKSGERADSTTEFGVTLLHIAAMNKSDGMDIIRYFTLEAGLDLEKKDADGEEPIHYAVRLANFERAKELLILRNNLSNILHYFVTENNLKFSKIVHQHDGELVKEFDSKGRLALHIAAEFADPEMVKWLVREAGVDVEALSKDKSTALHFTARNSQIRYAREMMVFFLSKKLNKYAKNESGETPMHAALSVENVNVAGELLKAGVRFEMCDENILIYCVKNNKIESAKFIFDKNSHLLKVDSAGCNLLHIAAEFSNKEMCEWIVSKNVINPKDLCASELKFTVFHHVAKNKAHGVELISYFVGLKVDLNDINGQNKNMETPLHAALCKENIKVAEELLKFGADINVKIDNDNLLHFCIRKNKLTSAKFVAGVKPELVKEKCSGGETALQLALEHADLEFCTFLTGIYRLRHLHR